MKKALLILTLFYSILIYNLGAQPAGSYLNICETQYYSNEWVKVSEQPTTTCGFKPAGGTQDPGRNYNQITIRKLVGMPAGASSAICGSANIPSGWVKTYERSCTTCGYVPPAGTQQPGYYVPMFDVYNLNGLQPGSYANICENQIYPNGWVKVSEQPCTTCGFKPAGGTQQPGRYYNQITIRKIEGLAGGSTVSICGSASYPVGWIKVNERSCTTCGYVPPAGTQQPGYYVPMFDVYNLNGLPVGSYANVCENQIYPNGWGKVSEQPCTFCGYKPAGGTQQPGRYYKQITIYKANSSARVGVDFPDKISNESIPRAYPNPARTIITFSLNELAGAYQSYAVYDLSGKVVDEVTYLTEQQQQQLPVDVSTWPVGMYMIRITSKDRSSTIKFLVN